MNDLLVMVQIAGRRCALRASDVQSVIELGAVTPTASKDPSRIASTPALPEPTTTQS